MGKREVCLYPHYLFLFSVRSREVLTRHRLCKVKSMWRVHFCSCLLQQSDWYLSIVIIYKSYINSKSTSLLPPSTRAWIFINHVKMQYQCLPPHCNVLSTIRHVCDNLRRKLSKEFFYLRNLYRTTAAFIQIFCIIMIVRKNQSFPAQTGTGGSAHEKDSFFDDGSTVGGDFAERVHTEGLRCGQGN